MADMADMADITETVELTEPVIVVDGVVSQVPQVAQTPQLPHNPQGVMHAQDQLAQIAGSSGTLGALVCWNIERATVEMTALRGMLDAQGLTSIHMPPIRVKAAIQRALSEMAADGLVRPVTDNADRVVYALVRETVDQTQDDLSYTTELKVTYHKQGVDQGKYSFSSAAAEGVLDPIIQQYRTSYTARDITLYLLLEPLKAAGAITVRERGGMYFVPQQGLGLLDQLNNFVTDLATVSKNRSYIWQFPVLNDATAKDSIRRAAAQQLESELRAMTRQLGKLNNRADRVRANTASSALSDAQALGKRAQLYVDLCQLETARVMATIQELKNGFQALLAFPTGPSESTVESAVESAVTAATVEPEPEPEPEPEDEFAMFAADPVGRPAREECPF